MSETPKTIPELYGSLVFNDKVMRERLPKDIYKALHKTIQNGTHLELDVADVVAAAMKEWAVENGATHFTHWFQPMTGFTAEKHDSFISRERADQGRAGRLQLPFRRTSGHLRGQRLYRVGPVLSRFYQRRFFIYPYRLLFLQRGSSG